MKQTNARYFLSGLFGILLFFFGAVGAFLCAHKACRSDGSALLAYFACTVPDVTDTSAAVNEEFNGELVCVTAILAHKNELLKDPVFNAELPTVYMKREVEFLCESASGTAEWRAAAAPEDRRDIPAGGTVWAEDAMAGPYHVNERFLEKLPLRVWTGAIPALADAGYRPAEDGWWVRGETRVHYLTVSAEEITLLGVQNGCELLSYTTALGDEILAALEGDLSVGNTFASLRRSDGQALFGSLLACAILSTYGMLLFFRNFSRNPRIGGIVERHGMALPVLTLGPGMTLLMLAAAWAMVLPLAAVLAVILYADLLLWFCLRRRDK